MLFNILNTKYIRIYSNIFNIIYSTDYNILIYTVIKDVTVYTI